MGKDKSKVEVSKEIEPWDDFNEIDLSKKKYVSDDHRGQLSEKTKERWSDSEWREKQLSILRSDEHRKKLRGVVRDRYSKNLEQRKTKFIEVSQEVHGDKYDYSKVEYVRTNVKVTLICKKCGEFQIIPSNHTKGQGCRKCGNKNKGSGLTTEQFIRQCREIHGDKYDYSKVEYVDAHTKVIIICKEHGEHLQTPTNHKQNTGCPKCGNAQRRKTKSSPIEKVLQQFREVHGDKYDYSKVEYVNANTKVIIICKKHGEFLQIPPNHKNGQICPKCSLEIKKIESDKKRKEVRGLMQSGMSAKEVGKKMGLSMHMVYNYNRKDNY